MSPVEEMVLFRLEYHCGFQERPFRRCLEGLRWEESWTKQSMDGEMNDPAVWLAVRGEEEVLLGNPWTERGETLGLSKLDEETSIAGGDAVGGGEGWI